MDRETHIKGIVDKLVPTTIVNKLRYTPMTLGDYNNLREWITANGEDPKRKGYLIEYEPSEDNPPNVDGFDGYVSWTPAEALIKTMKDYAELVESITDAPKTLNITSGDCLSSNVEVYGNPDIWVCISKASNKKEGWMKSTKVLQLSTGCLVQVSTQQGSNVAEAIQFVPNAELRNINGNWVLR